MRPPGSWPTLPTARDSGLDRGFTTYHDFIFPRLAAFNKTALVARALAGIQSTATFLEDQLEVTSVRPAIQKLRLWFQSDRKAAADVNGELFDWLAHRGQSQRPFFAFLNYFDAHYPYQLPAGSFYRFGGKPVDTRQRDHRSLGRHGQSAFDTPGACVRSQCL